MGPFIHITADQVTTTGTTQLHPLGSLTYIQDERLASTLQGNGGQVWIYVKNGEASSAFAAGQLIVRKAGSNTKQGTIASATEQTAHAHLGVAQHAIAAGSYGWILRTGLGTIQADNTGITVDQGLVPGDDGTQLGAFDSSATETDATLGYAVDTIAADATGLAYIDCRG